MGFPNDEFSEHIPILCYETTCFFPHRIVVPPEIGYPENNMDLKGPKPITFSVSIHTHSRTMKGTMVVASRIIRNVMMTLYQWGSRLDIMSNIAHVDVGCVCGNCMYIRVCTENRAVWDVSLSAFMM